MCRSLTMVGGGVRGMLVVEFSLLVCFVDSRVSQESVLTSVMWPRMSHLCVSERHGAVVVLGSAVFRCNTLSRVLGCRF